MEDLSMHILDIAENSITAGASRVDIVLVEDESADLLSLEIRDDGRGMDEELLKQVCSPFATTRTTRSVGLGLSFLAQSAEMAGGRLTVESRKGEGTRVVSTFQRSHIDRIPIGDLEEMLLTLSIGNPDIDFFFSYRRGERVFDFETGEIRKQLDGVPFSHPEVIRAFRALIREGLAEAGVIPPYSGRGADRFEN